MANLDKYMDAIALNSRARGLDKELVKAIIMQESGGAPWAVRYERHYKWTADWATGLPWRVGHGRSILDFPHPRGVSRRTEYIMQQTSFGLLCSSWGLPSGSWASEAPS